jgi:hypothetical protein
MMSLYREPFPAAIHCSICRSPSELPKAAIGLALRQQRLNLPSADQYFAGSDARQIEMSGISNGRSSWNGCCVNFPTPKS